MNRRSKIIHNASPVALTLNIGTTPVALINNDEIEVIGRVITKVRCRFTIFIRSAHKGLENGKEYAAIHFENIFSESDELKTLLENA